MWSWLSWLFGEEEKQVLPPAPEIRHPELACEYFWLPVKEQLKFLYYLGVAPEEQGIIQQSARAFEDVQKILDEKEPPEGHKSAEVFLRRLKAVYLDGRPMTVLAVLQNIFRDKHEAAKYTVAVKNWGG